MPASQPEGSWIIRAISNDATRADTRLGLDLSSCPHWFPAVAWNMASDPTIRTPPFYD
jgi:hypothetical protein